jgi:serine protease Do
MLTIATVLFGLLASTQLPRVPAEESARIVLLQRIEKSVVRINVNEGDTDGSQAALGSGVVASPDGLIITAAHVVADARAVEVTLFNGASQTATVVYLDRGVDIALLRLQQPPPAEALARLGDSDALPKGSTVYVIGNPFGLESSVASGIVSGRHSAAHVFGRDDGADQAELIQTDAAMNSGVSGGPMFNSRGEVIAIAQSILSKSGGSEGLGFGLAINSVKKILALDPCVYLGFSAVPLTGDLAGAFNIGVDAGLLVQYVAPGGPAEQAGLRAGSINIGTERERIVLGGDVITHIDGVAVNEWRRMPFTSAAEGDVHEITFRVVRRGTVVELKGTTIHRSHW